MAAGYKGPVPATLPTDLPEFAIPIEVLQTRGITKGSRFVQQVLMECLAYLATWLHGRTLKLYTNASLLPLLGVKQDYKGEGMLQPLYHRRTFHRSHPFVASPEEESVVPTFDLRVRSGHHLGTICCVCLCGGSAFPVACGPNYL
jgi:hypothetical protein